MPDKEGCGHEVVNTQDIGTHEGKHIEIRCMICQEILFPKKENEDEEVG